MRILVLVDAWLPFVGGAQIQIKNLQRILESEKKAKFFILHSPSANILLRFFWGFWVIPQAVILNKKYHFDLIHSHAYWPAVPGKIIAELLKIPLVFTVHGSNLLDLGVKTGKALLEKIILTKIKYDQVISVSSSFLKYKNVNKDINVIANGVDVNEFKIKCLKNKIKDKNSRIKILFVGRKDWVKGLKYLEKAMIRVKKEFPRTYLNTISGGMKYGQLVREYKSSHVFVLPSLSEGQPLTLLEAWAAKLPVVATKVGDNPKMVKNGFNGFLAEPKDAEELARLIIKVLRNKKRDLLGERGYQLVKKQYSWEKCGQKTLMVYEKALAEN